MAKVWKITKITKKHKYNIFTGKPRDYYYIIVMTKSYNPFKTKIKKVTKEKFNENEFYVGRNFL